MKIKTVGELIIELQKLPQDMKIVARSNNYELNGNKTEGVYLSKTKGDFESRSFMDDFDHTSYSTTVFIPNSTGSEEVIEIWNS